MAMPESTQSFRNSFEVYSPPLISAFTCAARATAGVDGVSIVPPREIRNTLHEHRPMPSGVLVQRKRTVAVELQVWRFPVSRSVRTADFVDLAVQKRWRPMPGTAMAEVKTGIG